MKNRLFKNIMVCGLIMACGSIHSQKRSVYFGKHNQLTIDKDVYWGLLFGKEAVIKGKSNILPRIGLFKSIGKHTMMGFSIAHGKHTIDHSIDFDFYRSPLDYHGIGIFVYHGEGPMELKSTAWQIHFKKFNKMRTLVPVGLYTSVDMGVSKSKLLIGNTYFFIGDDGLRYRPSASNIFRFTQLLLAFNVGKSTPLYKDRLLYDISFGIGTKIMITNHSDYVKDELVIDASRFLLVRQVFNLKAGINYAF